MNKQLFTLCIRWNNSGNFSTISKDYYGNSMKAGDIWKFGHMFNKNDKKWFQAHFIDGMINIIALFQ